MGQARKVLTDSEAKALLNKLADEASGIPSLKVDPRSLSNTESHVERQRPETAMTRGQAAKFRKATMKACQCRLCAMALNPPMTFEEAERFGLTQIEREDEELFFKRAA